MDVFISLVDRTIAKSKERISVYSAVYCGYRIIRLNNTIVVENCYLIS